MATFVGRLPKQALLKANSGLLSQKARFSLKNSSKGKKLVMVALAGTASVAGVGAYIALTRPVMASTELVVEPAKMPWSHQGMFKSIDRDSARRGYEVYKQVCAACHSLQFIHYRDLVGELFTEAEAKEEAKQATVIDGPDDTGEMFERKGKLSDPLPKPYKNDEEGRAANNGALPPDLSLIVRASEEHEDYIFALLTGYQETPANFPIGEEQHYNPYFPGHSIGMAQALYNEIIEYQDGTPATQSQLAKDVVIFLTWAGEKELDERKKRALKGFLVLGTMLAASYFATKWKFSYQKAKRLAMVKR